MTGELAIALAGQIGVAAAVYAAIRADLREALVRVGIVEKRCDRLEGVKP